MIRLLTTLLLLCPGLAGAACEGENLIEALTEERHAAMAQAVSRAPYPVGNFWRAERPGSTVHVLGTLHIPDPRHATIIDDVEAAIRSADLVILEVTRETEHELQSVMVNRPEIAIITQGPSLIDLMGEKDWEPVAQALAERGIPPFMGAKFQPWLLMIILSLPSCALEDMASGELGLDGQVEAIARDAEIPLAELDELDALIDLLDAGTLEEQIEMLRFTVAAPIDQAAVQATMTESYFAGRHREIWEFNRLLAEETADPGIFAQMEAQLLDARNDAWAAKLPPMLDGQNSVIAVGAAHLSGGTGVLRTLERMGYSLTRLPLGVETAR